MPDLTKELLPRLQSHRLPGLNLPEEFIHPNYEGQSILNIPNSICTLLGAPPASKAPALIPQILNPLQGNIQKVLLILMDALSLQRLQRWMVEEPDLVWNRLSSNGLLAPLTSISPSTTSAALTTLWTAQPPASHGITGYEMWLKEYGVVANAILHKPITFSGRAGSLEQAGFTPEDFLPVASVGPHMATNGIETHAFQHYSIIHSGLSRMFMNYVDRHPVSGAVDLWVTVRELWENSQGKRLYSWVYYGEVDGLSHFFGPDNERCQGEFFSFSNAFEQFFLNKLSPEARQGTLVILIADHGQIATPKEETQYSLANHPELTRRLHMLPTGENRMAYLYIQPGESKAVQEYIEQTWPSQFVLLPSAEAIEQGLFGPGKPHPDLLSRTGDLIALARGKAYWWWAAKENPLTGRHGGMSAEEMIVPFLAVPL